MLDFALLGAIWLIGLPAAIYATIQLLRVLDRHLPMGE